MNRIADLTYELSRLEQDIASINDQLSRQSTPVPRPRVIQHSVSQGPRSRRAPRTSSGVSQTRTGSVSPDMNDQSRVGGSNSGQTGAQGSPSPQSGRTHSGIDRNDQRKTIVKPATYDGKTSWIDFKSHFEICAQLNDWIEDEKGLHLAVLLRDGAQAVLGNLPTESRKNFTELCKALEDRYAPSNQTELYRAQLRDRRQKASESITELGQDVRRLTNLAFVTAPADVRETLAKEQFIDALHSSEMRLRIKQSRPKNLNEVVCLAVELDAFDSAEKRRQEPTGFVRAVEGGHTTDLHASVEKMITETNKALAEMSNQLRDHQALWSNQVERTLTATIVGKKGILRKSAAPF